MTGQDEAYHEALLIYIHWSMLWWYLIGCYYDIDIVEHSGQPTVVWVCLKKMGTEPNLWNAKNSSNTENGDKSKGNEFLQAIKGYNMFRQTHISYGFVLWISAGPSAPRITVPIHLFFSKGQAPAKRIQSVIHGNSNRSSKKSALSEPLSPIGNLFP